MKDFPALQAVQQARERVLKEYDNPQSLINLVPKDFRAVVESLPDNYLNLPEDELEQIFPNPSETVSQIRKLFWFEFDRAVECRAKMDLSRTYTGVCTKEVFVKLIRTPQALVWILTPPVEYTAQVEEMLTFALKQVREILKLPIKSELGFIDAKLADTKLRAAVMLDNRLKGAYVQRSMQINQNINEHRHIKQVESQTHEELDAEIKRLEDELSKVKALPDVSVVATMSVSDKVVDRVVVDAEFSEVSTEHEGKRARGKEGASN